MSGTMRRRDRTGYADYHRRLETGTSKKARRLRKREEIALAHAKTQRRLLAMAARQAEHGP